MHAPDQSPDGDALERHIRFVLPDAVAELPEKADGPGVWMGGDDGKPELLYVPEAGCFVRAILRVALTENQAAFYGLWMKITEEELKHASRIWSNQQYPEFALTGVIANQVLPWELGDRPVQVRVLDPQQLPYCFSSSDALVTRVLTETWPYEDVANCLPE